MSEMRFGLPKKAIEKMCEIFTLHPEIDQVILYGSRALGTYKNGSDIDLTLKGRKLGFRTLHQIEEELEELLLPWMIDINLYEKIENKDLIAHINDNGMQIYPPIYHGNG